MTSLHAISATVIYQLEIFRRPTSYHIITPKGVQRTKRIAALKPDRLQEAIAMEPSDAALFQNRALCFQKLARWQSVVNDATKAAELAPSSVRA